MGHRAYWQEDSVRSTSSDPVFLKRASLCAAIFLLGCSSGTGSGMIGTGGAGGHGGKAAVGAGGIGGTAGVSGSGGQGGTTTAGGGHGGMAGGGPGGAGASDAGGAGQAGGGAAGQASAGGRGGAGGPGGGAGKTASGGAGGGGLSGACGEPPDCEGYVTGMGGATVTAAITCLSPSVVAATTDVIVSIYGHYLATGSNAPAIVTLDGGSPLNGWPTTACHLQVQIPAGAIPVPKKMSTVVSPGGWIASSPPAQLTVQ